MDDSNKKAHTQECSVPQYYTLRKFIRLIQPNISLKIVQCGINKISPIYIRFHCQFDYKIQFYPVWIFCLRYHHTRVLRSESNPSWTNNYAEIFTQITWKILNAFGNKNFQLFMKTMCNGMTNSVSYVCLYHFDICLSFMG